MWSQYVTSDYFSCKAEGHWNTSARRGLFTSSSFYVYCQHHIYIADFELFLLRVLFFAFSKMRRERCIIKWIEDIRTILCSLDCCVDSWVIIWPVVVIMRRAFDGEAAGLGGSGVMQLGGFICRGGYFLAFFLEIYTGFIFLILVYSVTTWRCLLRTSLKITSEWWLLSLLRQLRFPIRNDCQTDVSCLCWKDFGTREVDNKII